MFHLFVVALAPNAQQGYVEPQMDSVRVDTGVNFMVLTLKESHNIMFTTLTGNNLLVWMRAKGNKSLNFQDILEICQRSRLVDCPLLCAFPAHRTHEGNKTQVTLKVGTV